MLTRTFHSRWFVALVIAALSGCTADPPHQGTAATPRHARPVADPAGRFADAEVKPEGEPLLAEPAVPATELEKAQAAPRREGWGILLETFDGARHEELAAQRAVVLQQALRRSDIVAVERSGGSAIILGQYAGPKDEAAARDLAMVKQARAPDGRSLFAFSHMVPPPLPGPGGDPSPFNLRNLHKLDRQAKYTLEIAIFGSEDRAEARRAAEELVQRLREDGKEAFYFHGRTRSAVAIGAFTELEYNPESYFRSAEVRALQAEYPYKAFNGRQRLIGPQKIPTPTHIVPIPR